MRVVPISLKEANEFVREHHRHHQPIPGAKFCIACFRWCRDFGRSDSWEAGSTDGG